MLFLVYPLSVVITCLLPNVSCADERALTSYANENQRNVFLGQGMNISQGQPSMHMLYQNFDMEESGIGNTPTDSSPLLLAETEDNQLLLDDISSLLELEGMDLNTNNNNANQLMSEHDTCFVTDHAGLEHAVNQNGDANGLIPMPKPLAWLPPQEMNATATMIPPRNQSLYHIYHVQEPTEENVETLNPNLIHHWDDLYGGTWTAS